MDEVRYVLVRRPWGPRSGYAAGLNAGSSYELVREERGASEVVFTGVGLAMRDVIVDFLQALAGLGGPDAPAARRALEAGWSAVEGSGE